MTMTTHERDQLRRALSVYVDEAPPAPEWQDWDITRASDVSERSRLKGPMAALAAATIALVVIGSVGLVMQTTKNSPLGGPGEEPPTWGDWFDSVIASAEPIGDDPTILQAALGPEPEFDTSGLGEEQRLEPVTLASTDHSWDFFVDGPEVPNPTMLRREILLLAGQVESSVVGVGLYAESYDRGQLVTDGLCQTIAQSFPADQGGAAAGGGCAEQTEPINYGVFNYLGVGDLKDVTVYVSAAFIVPPDTSIVAVESSEIMKWQRPRGGIALFVGEFLVSGETMYTAYSATGDVLLQGTNDIRILEDTVGAAEG